MYESKRLALLRILQIFQVYSDAEHPLLQEDILRLLQKDYGISLERKAVGRNISYLREAGYAIESDNRGSFLAEKPFEDSELRLLIDGILSSKHITEKHSRELIARLCEQTNIYFHSRVKNIYSVGEWSKTDNCALFYNIDVIDEAIEKHLRIRFDYNRYGTDKKLHKSDAHEVSAFQMLLHNQRYYLFAYSEKRADTVFYRLDRITNISLTDIPSRELREIGVYENGINYRELSSAFPYMYSDKPVAVEFVADKRVVDQIVDWFGNDTVFSRETENTVNVKVCVSPKAMEYWAMQYGSFVTVTSPAFLRDKIARNLLSAAENYKK